MSIIAYDANGQNPITLVQLGETNTYIDNITAIPYTVTSTGTGAQTVYYYHSEYIPEAVSGNSDFIGFSFNGISHTAMGISRVSEGSRYSEQMLPNFQDKSAQMPGSDYTLYWESFYSTRTWTLQIAFDSMTDEHMRLLRQTLNTKNLGELTFAERPGIHWLAKVQSPPQLKYICFDEDGTRIYKGEGTVTFISYYPFGMSDLNKTSTISTSTSINNIGDIPMDWYVILPAAACASISVIKDEVSGSAGNRILNFANHLTLKSGETYVAINSKTNLIEGCTYNSSTGIYTPNGNVYNSQITSGDFFQIPLSSSTFFANGGVLCYRYLYL